jgi:hypothetical protein
MSFEVQKNTITACSPWHTVVSEAIRNMWMHKESTQNNASGDRSISDMIQKAISKQIHTATM